MTDNHPKSVWVSTVTGRKLWVTWKVIGVSQAQKSTKQKMKPKSKQEQMTQNKSFRCLCSSSMITLDTEGIDSECPGKFLHLAKAGVEGMWWRVLVAQGLAFSFPKETTNTVAEMSGGTVATKLLYVAVANSNPELSGLLH